MGLVLSGWSSGFQEYLHFRTIMYLHLCTFQDYLHFGTSSTSTKLMLLWDADNVMEDSDKYCLDPTGLCLDPSSVLRCPIKGPRFGGADVIIFSCPAHVTTFETCYATFKSSSHRHLSQTYDATAHRLVSVSETISYVCAMSFGQLVH
jgi:hypothetical protein